MLKHLKIRNLALLEGVDLDFQGGFTAITGETGAGKSVLIGALSLLSGGRIDKSCIRQGADYCEVEALLEFPLHHPMHSLLELEGLPACEEGLMLVRRLLFSNKASRASINGVFVTASILQRVADEWIDFHGPEAPSHLSQEAQQRRLLDAFAKNQTLLASYQKLYAEWSHLLKEIQSMKEVDVLCEDERVFYQSQLDKIQKAEVSIDKIEELELAYSRKEKSDELLDHLEALSSGLGKEGGVGQGLGKLLREAEALQCLDPSLTPLQERLYSLWVEADDLCYEYSQSLHQCRKELLNSGGLEEQMNRWLEVKRLYGPSVEQVLARREQLEKRLISQEILAGRLADLELEAQKKEAQLCTLAASLDKKRKELASQLRVQVEALLPDLGLKKARFLIQVLESNSLEAHGKNRIQYLFSANVGQAPLPLGSIASSGEMARVMLALKSVLAKVEEAPLLLVFDEVDANVGGEIGSAIGDALAKLGACHQVFAVTHLPQVAARAQGHIVVTKTQFESNASVEISFLASNSQDRLEELARMLGDRQSSSALEHAKTLLFGVLNVKNNTL